MRVLSLGTRLNRPEYKDIFRELQKFNDIEFAAVLEGPSSFFPTFSINSKKYFFSIFSKKANSSYEKNQLRKILYEFSPEIIEIHAEPHQRISNDIMSCCDDIGLSPSFIIYPEQTIKDLLIHPYHKFRKETMSKASFIVIRNNLLKEEIKTTPFRNSYRKIAFPAYSIEKSKNTDSLCNILVYPDKDTSEIDLEILFSLSDYSERLRFNIVENRNLYKRFKNNGFSTGFLEHLSREEMISLLSRTDLVISDNDTASSFNTLIPFAFFNKIPCLAINNSDTFIDIKTLNEYQLKKLILGDTQQFTEIIDNAQKIALRDFSAGKCAFETYELYKFLFKTRIKQS